MIGLDRRSIMKKRNFTVYASTIVLGFLLLLAASEINAQKRTEFKVEPLDKAASQAAISTDGLQVLNLKWQTAVNNSVTIPGNSVKFSSYGQPSINTNGLAVFRARSTGGRRMTGIYFKHMHQGAVLPMVDINTLVPFPNNLNTEFAEFSAFPRIAANANYAATNGLHQPVYRYLLPDGTETRAGTSGIYVDLGQNLLVTGASKLGAAPGFEFFQVPGTKYVPFDIFPGAPAITDNGTIVFKGNFAIDGVGKTGIFFRDVLDTPGGGNKDIQMIASSDNEIPNAPPSAKFRMMAFESTSPPSVAGNDVVFLGLDLEADPHYGGIFMAPIRSMPELIPLIGIGEKVPGTDLPEITRLGEALAFDGRYLVFWGAWGDQMKTIRLYCAVDGNPELLAYCNGIDPNSIYDPVTDRWYQEKEVPQYQGIFLYDILLKKGELVANTMSDFNDFVFWGYSGKVPGSGQGDDVDAEPPRWRGTSFVALSDGLVVFKARTGTLAPNNEYVDVTDGLYLGEPLKALPLRIVAETGMDAAMLDPNIPGNAPMPIIGLGLERDGFRGRYLAITASMANDEESWGGIYVADVRAGRPHLTEKANLKSGTRTVKGPEK